MGIAKEGLPEAFCPRCEEGARVITGVKGQRWVVCLTCKYKYAIDITS